MAANASPDEAAAVVAAVERFIRDTAPPAAQIDPPVNPWLLDALHEGVSRAPELPLPWD